MSRHCFSRTGAVVAFLALIGGAWLPPAHVHYAPEGHHAAVVHRHFSAPATSTALDAPDDDDHAQELRDTWLAGRPFVFPLGAEVTVRVWGETPSLARRESVVSAALRIDSGPPLPTRLLRGPPPSL